MGRRRSVQVETPLRRSSRLRNIRPAFEPEDTTEDSRQVPERGERVLDHFTVVLNKLKPEDDEEGENGEREKRENSDMEDQLKTNKPPTSRIPTFQTSAARKRPTSQGLEPLLSPPIRGDSSSHLAQAKGRGNSGGESKAKVPGSRETALPVPLTRLPPSSTDVAPHVGLELLRSASDVVTTDSQQPQPQILTPRPALRSELEPNIANMPPGTAPEHTVQSESKSMGLPLLKDAEFEALKSSCNTLIPGEKLKTGVQGAESAFDEKKQNPQSVEMGESCSGPGVEDELTEKKAFSGDTGAEQQSVGQDPGEAESKEDSTRSKLQASGGNKVSKSQRVDVALVKEPMEKQACRTSAQAASRNVSRSQSTPRVGWLWSPCSFFILSSLLLLGGLGLHLWCRGTPASVSDLLLQMELEWLEDLWSPQKSCSSDCSFTLVESIPEGLEFATGSPVLPPISEAWAELLNWANSTVNIAAFYFTLRATDMGTTEPSALKGEQVFEQLMQLESRGLKLQMAVNGPQSALQDTADLAAAGAEVRTVDLHSLTGGVVHTKLWVVDNAHFYLGSANMDWRSLTQVKEVGVSVKNCSCLAEDASRLFGVYWHLGSQEKASLPPFWPARYSALSSAQHPLLVKFNNVPAHVYLSSAPPSLAAQGRTNDLTAILSVISDAQNFISISVMDYLPFSQFTKPPRFWPAIDSALRAAACGSGVEVKILVSCWPHSPGAMFIFLQSLIVLSQEPLSCRIQVKVFEVPATAKQQHIPFARVNHAKYMVTDRAAYIGTSNWSENYFTQTAGVGLVVNQTGIVVGQAQQTVQSQLHKVFQRDWISSYAQNLSHEHVKRCGRHNPA